MKPEIASGNAHPDGAAHRGWFVGHFVDARGDPRSTGAVEVKWGVHRGGERRRLLATSGVATTLSVLVGGRFRISFPDREVVLSQQGDYALWTAGVPHTWSAEEDSVVLTVRWPSRPADVREEEIWRNATEPGL